MIAHEFLAELRLRTPMFALVGERVKLSRAGHDMKGCCPFHEERTPSFFVYEGESPHAKCYGCGWHGDAMAYVMQLHRMSFTEAVTQLAAAVGMTVPVDAATEALEAQVSRLRVVLAAALVEYQNRLRSPKGGEAMAYLLNRGLSRETIDAYQIGWSGRNAVACQDHESAVKAGLIHAASGKRPEMPFFINRIMFPLRDGHARLVGFSGRALGDNMPKYVNSPDTPLFQKSRVLYGIDIASKAARAGAAITVVEGQIDMLQAHQAGHLGTVASLGTSLSEAHLRELWRMSPSPVLCFDGDAAGRAAARRAINAALPLLTATQVLRLAWLPDGLDPDAMIRRDPAAYAACIAAPEGLPAALHEMLRAEVDTTTPEGRAGLLNALEAASNSVRDRTMAAEYRNELRGLFYAGRRPHLVIDRGLAHGVDPIAERARTLLAILLRHPEIMAHADLAVADMPADGLLGGLRDAVLAAHADGAADLMGYIRAAGLLPVAESVLADRPEVAVDSDNVMARWWSAYGPLVSGRLDRQIAEAKASFKLMPTAAEQSRLIALCEARLEAQRNTMGL